jgi:MFS superfamily sulfate permease-like transporter
VIPFPLLSFVPNFFFGSLLSLICVDLVYEWLWDIRTKVTPVEYIVCLATFGFVQLLSVEYGILAGVVFYLICKKMGLDVGEIKYMRHEEEAETMTGKTAKKIHLRAYQYIESIQTVLTSRQLCIEIK